MENIEKCEKIQDRFSAIFPKAKVYWNGNINQLSLHFMDCDIDTKTVQSKVYAELSKTGMLEAVESVKILSY